MKITKVLIICLSFSSCFKKNTIEKTIIHKPSNDSLSLEKASDIQKVAYALGHEYGGSVKPLDLTKEDVAFLIQGLKDQLNDQSKMSLGDVKFHIGEVNAVLTKKREESLLKKSEQGKKWIAQVLSDDNDYQVTKSGLAYKVIKQGNVQKESSFKKVLMKYKVIKEDGTIVSSMDGRNALELRFSDIFKAWKEAYFISGDQGHIEIIAPSTLTYGKDGALPNILPGEYLKFKIEFFSTI